MPECETGIVVSVVRGKLQMRMSDVMVFRRNGDLSPLCEVLDGEVARFHTEGIKKVGLSVEKAMRRLLRNLEFDLASCSCAPNDPCPAHELLTALSAASKQVRK